MSCCMQSPNTCRVFSSVHNTLKRCCIFLLSSCSFHLYCLIRSHSHYNAAFFYDLFSLPRSGFKWEGRVVPCLFSWRHKIPVFEKGLDAPFSSICGALNIGAFVWNEVPFQDGLSPGWKFDIRPCQLFLVVSWFRIFQFSPLSYSVRQPDNDVPT